VSLTPSVRFRTVFEGFGIFPLGPTIVALAATVVLTVVTADAAERKARPAQPTEATAPRDAGEPIMAIVSIKSQQVIFYDGEGWILRAPVSTGVKDRETPAGVFAVVDKEKDHRSNMYDDAWMPNNRSERRHSGRFFPPRLIDAEGRRRRSCSGACRDARPRSRGGCQSGG
jgi:hypothetical protein